MTTRVVGLMPTYNRPSMAHRAIHLFLEQSYQGGRLVIFDDGELPIIDCRRCRSQIELVTCERMNLPRKRNAMMSHVGDHDAIYFMWDDDDYHGPLRIERQLGALDGHAACLMRPTLYFNSITRELKMSSWVSDATIAYRWDFWTARQFPEQIDPGSGYQFVTGRHGVVEIHGELDYMTVVHAGQRHTPPAFGPPDFYDAPVSAEWALQRLRMP